MFLKKRRHAQLMGLIKENGGTSYTSPLTPPTSGGEEDSEYEQEGAECRKIGGGYQKGCGVYKQDFSEHNLGFKLRKMSESSVDSGCGMPSSEVNIIVFNQTLVSIMINIAGIIFKYSPRHRYTDFCIYAQN